VDHRGFWASFGFTMGHQGEISCELADGSGISTVLLWLANAIRHCFLMLALLRPSRRTRKNRNQQQSAASGC